jgi:predicted nucleotidyltransferase
VWVVALEDLIVLKLQAARPRDLDDAVALLRANRGRIDDGLLDATAALFGVEASLRDRRAEAG